jgi:hypothetical protein
MSHNPLITYSLFSDSDLRIWRRLVKRRLLQSAAKGGRAYSNGTLQPQKRGEPNYLDPWELELQLNGMSAKDVENPEEIDPALKQFYKEIGIPWSIGYSGAARELNFYLVEIEGEFEWAYSVPICSENRLPSEPEWMLWKSESIKKDLTFYKYGITKHSDITKRFRKQRVRTLFDRTCSLNVAFNAENLFCNRLNLRFPKSAGPTTHGSRYHGRSQGITTAFAGASESFIFWRSEECLLLLADEVICSMEAIVANGGIELLKRYQKAIKVLEYSLLGTLEIKLDIIEADSKCYKWASDNFVGTARTAPRSGDIEELHDWAINRVMNWYEEFSNESKQALSQIQEYVKVKTHDCDLLSIASENFIDKLSQTVATPPLLAEFGKFPADFNKLKKWKTWCNVDVAY